MMFFDAWTWLAGLIGLAGGILVGFIVAALFGANDD